MSISKAEHDELCCVYAGLLLFDDKVEITSEKLLKVIEASGNKVDSYYPEFFASYLKGADINKMLTAQPAAGAAPAEHHDEHKDDKKDDKKGGKKDDKKGKEKAKPKVEEEEEEGGFMDMFG